MARPDYYGNPAGLTDEAAAVRAVYAAFARRDPEAALPYLARDCRLDLRGTADASERSEPYVGHAGVSAYFDDVDGVWDELVLHPDDFRVLPGVVIVLGRVLATRAGRSAARRVTARSRRCASPTPASSSTRSANRRASACEAKPAGNAQASVCSPHASRDSTPRPMFDHTPAYPCSSSTPTSRGSSHPNAHESRRTSCARTSR